jgi:hypothetical protein
MFGIYHSLEGSPTSVGLTYFDRKGNPNDHKSTIGYVFNPSFRPII